MDIDLKLLHSHTKEEIDVTGEYTIPKSYYENTDVIQLSSVKLSGRVYLDEDVDGNLTDYIDCKIIGNMIIPDAISLEEVSYPFDIDFCGLIEENNKKNENTLDIFQFLWENIFLEVPLQFTKVEDLSKFHGDGWKLISEDELRNANNPFNDLLKDIEKE